MLIIQWYFVSTDTFDSQTFFTILTFYNVIHVLLFTIKNLSFLPLSISISHCIERQTKHKAKRKPR